MKNIIKFIGLLSLICFSFFYTDKVMDVALEQDKIMINIKNTKDNYKIKAIDAIINNDTIIPGIYGREVDIDKSYSNMKSIGIFHKNYFVYNDIKPDISIMDNRNKYIISANGNKQSVSLIFIINNFNDLNIMYNFIKTKDIKVNLFFDYDILTDKINYLSKFKNAKIYSYGNNGIYTKDNLIYINNLIERVTKNKANYCLVTKKDKDKLKICSDSLNYTIFPNLIIDNNLLYNVKNKLVKGSLILIDINDSNMKQLVSVIDYINSKGLKIEYIDDLLSESL